MTWRDIVFWCVVAFLCVDTGRLWYHKWKAGRAAPTPETKDA